MNSIFLDPSNEFLTQAVNIGIPKQTLGLCFHVSKWGHKVSYEYHGGGYTGDCRCSCRLPRLAGVQKIGPGIWLAKQLNIKISFTEKAKWRLKLKNWKITLGQWSTDVLRFGFYYSYKDASYRTLKSWHKVLAQSAMMNIPKSDQELAWNLLWIINLVIIPAYRI